MAFSTSYEPQLESLLLTLGQADASRWKALSQATQTSSAERRKAIEECLAIAIIFLEGFADVAAKGPLHSKVSTPVQNWVAQVPRSQSGTRLAGMVAASICSILEDYLLDAAAPKLDPAELPLLRGRDPNLPSADAEALATLTRRVKPSVKAQGSKWVAALETVFGYSLSQEEGETLIDLITFRNLYIHDPVAAFAATVTGEQLKCWTLAAMLLIHRTALS